MKNIDPPSTEKRLHMAGLLVHAAPGRANDVAARISRLAGAAVHAAAPNGKLVVTLESERSADILERLVDIQKMAGVFSAVLVSEHNEPLANADEEISDER